MKIFESITLEGILLMALGLILGSSSNLLFIVIGGTIFIVGVVFPILKSELSPIGRSYWKLVEAEDVARELKTRMFYVPSGIPGHDFAGGRAGGDNIAFFVESNSKEYFNYLASFVSQGIKNIEKEEIVIFVARDEDSKRYFFSQKEIDASSDRLYVITLEDLPQPEEGKDFFTVIKPVVDALVQTIEERRGDKKVDLIRLITDDLSILQGREDFRLLMIEFNANLEKQISRYPYFRNPAFFSVGTYVLSSLKEFAKARGKSISAGTRSILRDNNPSETMVLTEKKVLLVKDLALKYILDNDAFWEDKNLYKIE